MPLDTCSDAKSALPTFRRVLLISHHPTTHLISIRHYTITVRAHGVTRRVRKLLTAQLPQTDADLADYLLRRGSTAGYDTASETEASEGEDATTAVELSEDYGRGNKKGERKAVRLVETGPRMELRLIKVVEGLVGSRKGEGETVFHEFGMLFDRPQLTDSAQEQIAERGHAKVARGKEEDQGRTTCGTGCKRGEEEGCKGAGASGRGGKA